MAFDGSGVRVQAGSTISENAAESNGYLNLASNLVDKLGADPCVLAIVTVVAICGFIVVKALKSGEKLEQIRMAQWSKLLGKDEPNGTD